MPIEIDAIYEDGVLKPMRPLPLAEHSRVVVSVRTSDVGEAKPFVIRQWRGDPEVLRQIAENPEHGMLESP